MSDASPDLSPSDEAALAALADGRLDAPERAELQARVDAPAAADVKGTAIQVRNTKINSKLKRGVYTARVQILCPLSELGGCQGTLALLTAKAVNIGGVKVTALLGSKSYALKAGQSKTLSIRLPKGVRKFAKQGTLSLRAVSTSRDAAGNVATGSSKLAVKLVK